MGAGSNANSPSGLGSGPTSGHSNSPHSVPLELIALPPDTPRLGSVAGYLGGLFILTEGLVELVGGAYYTVFGFSGLSGTIYASLGVALGILTRGCSWLLTQTPPHQVTLGVVILALGLTSILVGGGFAIGLLLCLGSGVLAIAWRPAPPFYFAPVGTRMCLACGVSYDTSSKSCPTCGTPAQKTAAFANASLAEEFR